MICDRLTSRREVESPPRTAFALSLVLVFLFSAPVAAVDIAQFARLESSGRAALERWDYAEADRISHELLKLVEHEDETSNLRSQAHKFRGLYCYWAGDYPCAFEEMEKTAAVRPLTDRERAFKGRMARLARLFDESRQARSEHFLIRWAEDKDSVLVEPALEALELAYQALTGDIGIETNSPILVEVYPSFADFSAATGLTEEDLENSGTIAVCKYRRIMINTPRILVRGYSYRDTLSHELVHFLLYERFGESVPIWLHEGVAKYLELRWRTDRAGELLPSQRSLLASALRMNELITFDRMHPSFAKLKSPRQGQLAFAQVSTTVDYLVHRGGFELVLRLCKEMGKHPDYRKAVEKATGMSFERFWSSWVNHARSKGYEELPGMEITVYEIRRGDPGFEDEDVVSESDLAEGAEWRLVRLGDLLRDRGHYRAAAVQYERARAMAPYSVRILNKLGLCYYLAEEHELALDPLGFAAEFYPGFSTTYINRGRALWALGREDDAAADFLRVLDINPFNPLPYGYLIKYYDKQGDRERAEKLARDFAVISGQGS